MTGIRKDLTSTDVYVPANTPGIPPVNGVPRRRKRLHMAKDGVGDILNRIIKQAGRALLITDWPGAPLPGPGTLPRLVKDAGTYAGRLLQNTDELADWLDSLPGLGLGSWRLDDNVHTTIAHSVVGFGLDHPDDMIEATAEQWGILGKDDAVVLYLASPELIEDHNETDEAGARWDFPIYRPHLTLFYQSADESQEWVNDRPPLPPFPLVFGPIITAPLGRDAFAGEIAKFDASEPRDADGEWAAGGGATMDHWPVWTPVPGKRPWIMQGADGSTHGGKHFESSQQALSYARRMKLPVALTYNGKRVVDGMQGRGNAARRLALRTTSGPSFLRHADGGLVAAKSAGDVLARLIAKNAHDVSDEARDEHGRWTGGGLDPDTSKNNSPERKAKRDAIIAGWKIADKDHRDRKAIIVLGTSGSGKSKAVADRIEAAWGATNPDADTAKRGLEPEYNHGEGSGRVHEESAQISAAVQRAAVARGDNLVIPKVGANRGSIDQTINHLHEHGYDVTLSLVHVPVEVSAQRAAARKAGGGHGPEPEAIIAQDGHPERTYEALKLSPGVHHYVKFDNNVHIGQPPKLLESGDNPHYAGRKR